MIDQLEADRAESLKWAESKLKNPKRSVLKPEPWEEVAEGKYRSSSHGMMRPSLLWLTLKARYH